MSIDEPPPLTRASSAAALVVAIAVALCGAVSAATWSAIVVGAVTLLFTSDRGQHRWLAERAFQLGRNYVVVLSIATHLLNNLYFMTLAFVAGRVTRLLWWDAIAGDAGVPSELASWLIGAAIVIAIGEGAWRWLERVGRH